MIFKRLTNLRTSRTAYDVVIAMPNYSRWDKNDINIDRFS